MSYLHAIIIAVVEGITEFLPISSTAHLILAGEWLRIPSSDFLKTFEISIQLGAILAIVILYWKKVWNNWHLVWKIGTAFIPTAVIGFALYGIIKNYLFDSLEIIAGTLIVGGMMIIILEKFYSRRSSETNEPQTPDEQIKITYVQALLIGIFQSLAVVPGVSRAGATIIGGLGLGINRRHIVEFSFLLAIPTMAAATGYDLLKSSPSFTSQEITIWIAGFVMSFITAIIGVKFFLKFIQTRNFIPFGWYRIGLGLVVLAWLWL